MPSPPFSVFCGDGVVTSPWETCDGGLRCQDCANAPSPIRSNCAAYLDNGEISDGPYIVDVDGALGLDEIPVMCDMSGGGWTLIFDHTTAYSEVFSTETVGLSNETDPFSSLYSILDHIAYFDGSIVGVGGYEFRLTWPHLGVSNTWRQRDNPTEDEVVDCAEAVDIQAPDNWRGGLALASGDEALSWYLHGSTDTEPWHAVGIYLTGFRIDSLYGMLASPSLPDGGSTDRVQLWVRPYNLPISCE